MENQSTVNRQRIRKGESINAVQCGECFKWRVIPRREEFEEIRSTLIENPFVCSKKRGSCCEDTGDIEYDSSRIWAVEKPGLPKTPVGFKNEIVLRNNFSKFDCYYITPTGEKLRSTTQITPYLNQHPEIQGLSVSNFNFKSPKIMSDTVPKFLPKSRFRSSSKRAMDDEDKQH